MLRPRTRFRRPILVSWLVGAQIQDPLETPLGFNALVAWLTDSR